MNDKPTLSERSRAALGTAVYGAPVSYLFWLVMNWIQSTDGVNSVGVLAGIVLFIVLGFVFPRSFGQTLTFTPTPKSEEDNS